MSEFYLLENPLRQTFVLHISCYENFETKRCFIDIAIEYANRRVQINLAVLKLNGTHQLVVYADDVSILGGSVHTVQKNGALLFARK